jgi:hypothetical protein
MNKKKGFFADLFGSKSDGCCNMEIAEEKPKKKKGCCSMEIIEESNDCCCCDTNVERSPNDEKKD